MPMTITHAKSDTIADFTGTVTVLNSGGGTTTVAATDLVRPSDWNSAHQTTLSLTGSEIASLFSFNNGLSSTTNAGGVTAGISLQPYMEAFPFFNAATASRSIANGSWEIYGPYPFYAGLNKGQFSVLNTVAAGFLHGAVFSAASTGSVSRYYSYVQQIALYSQGAGASTSRLESAFNMQVSFLATWDLRLATANTSSGTISNLLTLSFPGQWDENGGVTYSSTTASGTTPVTTSTMASTVANNLITANQVYVTGSRVEIFGYSSTMPPGVFWVAHNNYTSSSSSGTSGGVGTAGTGFQTVSYIDVSVMNEQNFKRAGLSVSNTTTFGAHYYQGFLATTTSSPTSIVNSSDVRGLAVKFYWAYGRSTY